MYNKWQNDAENAENECLASDQMVESSNRSKYT
jgi:hypothetical protein